MVFADAAARDTALSAVKSEGMLAYLLDVNCLTVYSGSAWSTIGPAHGAWVNYTPTLTQSATVTNTVTYAAYHRVGRLITAVGRLDVTGSGTSNNAIEFGLPVAGRTTGGSVPIGEAWVFKGSDSTAYTGMALHHSASACRIVLATTGSSLADRYLGLTTAGGLTLASGDRVYWKVAYEAAGDA